MNSESKNEPAIGFAALLSYNESVYNTGLTKREYFAAMAMQGLIQSNTDNSFDFIAKKSIEMADIILDKL